jgi:hypothetical protein
MAAADTENIMAMLDQARKDLKAAETEKQKLFADKAKTDKDVAAKAKEAELAQEREQAAAMQRYDPLPPLAARPSNHKLQLCNGMVLFAL